MDEKVYYEQVRNEAKLFYKNIKEIPCAVLGGEKVRFTMVGFRHLVKKGPFLRPRKDQIRRFLLLKYIPFVLKNSDSLIIYTKEQTAEFWRISNQVENQTIRIIVRQLTGGEKHFFSIMNHKI